VNLHVLFHVVCGLFWTVYGALILTGAKDPSVMWTISLVAITVLDDIIFAIRGHA
jgi:hypothetical protein